VSEIPAGTPPYARIAAELSDRIAAGELRPGDRVPVGEGRRAGLRHDPGAVDGPAGRQLQRDPAPDPGARTDRVTADPAVDIELDGLFEFGLARLLDGFRALVPPGD
jgi:hypothetical protein